MKSSPFGFTPSGESVEVYTLTNHHGLAAKVMTYGGTIISLEVPDRRGRIDDIVLGFSTLDDYVADSSYFGAIVGRVAGRVSGGLISANGETHSLAINNPPNHLHGGVAGFDKRVWKVQSATSNSGSSSLRLAYHSPDGEEGYPGALDISITYTLNDRNEFLIETEASSNCVTPLSLTNHSYFNLAGEGSRSITNHELLIHAQEYVPVNDAMTLSGQLVPVAGQPNDFTQSRLLASAIPHLFLNHGDLYRLSHPAQSSAPRLAARVFESTTGRVMEVHTTNRYLQFYTSAFLDTARPGKSGHPYQAFSGLCLECEGYPDGTTQPELDDILVYPDHPQRHLTKLAFSTIS